MSFVLLSLNVALASPLLMQGRSVLSGIRKRGTPDTLAVGKLGLQALEFINEDELVEITPASIRLRKKTLASGRR